MASRGLLAHREGDRGYPWLWFVRAIGLVVTIITLGLTATGAASFHTIACDSPAKLNYNIAVTVLSFFALVYLLLSTGPTRPLKILPWFIFGQLAIDAVMFIFWLAAGSTSSYSCNDLCSACNGLYDIVTYANNECECLEDFFFKDKRATSPNPGNVLLTKRRSRLGGGHSSSSSKGGSGSAVIAFDAIMTILFFFCLVATVFWFTQDAKAARQRRTGAGSTNTAAAPPVAGSNEPIKHEEAGVTPAAYPQPGYPQPQQPQYTGQPPMTEQQQPTMYQVPHNPAGQQEQYQSPPVSNLSTSPPPPEGNAGMPNLNQGHTGAPMHGQTPG